MEGTEDTESTEVWKGREENLTQRPQSSQRYSPSDARQSPLPLREASDVSPVSSTSPFMERSDVVRVRVCRSNDSDATQDHIDKQRAQIETRIPQCGYICRRVPEIALDTDDVLTKCPLWNTIPTAGRNECFPDVRPIPWHLRDFANPVRRVSLLP
jgi:hypothetical protein